MLLSIWKQLSYLATSSAILKPIIRIVYYGVFFQQSWRTFNRGAVTLSHVPMPYCIYFILNIFYF